MAKSRKPAITGIARPQGVLDDVVYPIVQKAAKKVKARGVEKLMRTKRIQSYAKKGDKGRLKAEKALESRYRFGSPSAGPRMQKGNSKYYVNAIKIDAVDDGVSVRRQAQKARKIYPKRVNYPKKK